MDSFLLGYVRRLAAFGRGGSVDLRSPSVTAMARWNDVVGLWARD